MAFRFQGTGIFMTCPLLKFVLRKKGKLYSQAIRKILNWILPYCSKSTIRKQILAGHIKTQTTEAELS